MRQRACAHERIKAHRDKDNPQDSHDSDVGPIAAQIERAWLKALPVDEPHENRNAICMHQHSQQALSGADLTQHMLASGPAPPVHSMSLRLSKQQASDRGGAQKTTCRRMQLVKQDSGGIGAACTV